MSRLNFYQFARLSTPKEGGFFDLRWENIRDFIHVHGESNLSHYFNIENAFLDLVMRIFSYFNGQSGLDNRGDCLASHIRLNYKLSEIEPEFTYGLDNFTENMQKIYKKNIHYLNDAELDFLFRCWIRGACDVYFFHIKNYSFMRTVSEFNDFYLGLSLDIDIRKIAHKNDYIRAYIKEDWLYYDEDYEPKNFGCDIFDENITPVINTSEENHILMKRFNYYQFSRKMSDKRFFDNSWQNIKDFIQVHGITNINYYLQVEYAFLQLINGAFEQLGIRGWYSCGHSRLATRIILNDGWENINSDIIFGLDDFKNRMASLYQKDINYFSDKDREFLFRCCIRGICKVYFSHSFNRSFLYVDNDSFNIYMRLHQGVRFSRIVKKNPHIQGVISFDHNNTSPDYVKPEHCGESIWPKRKKRAKRK